MSFYKVGQNRRKKAPTRKRPVWDDSVQDLTVHRATPEEIFLRKEAHKSKNHVTVKLEKMRKEKQNSRLTGAEYQQLAIMKEVLYDQKQLQDVLAKSDTMMAVVKDLFGDDPKRFMGFPNVTTAPNSHIDPNSSNSLVASVPDIYTRSEKMSDTVMNQSALNDIESSESEDEETDQPAPISYEPKLNLQRFQEYLQEEEMRSAHMDPPSLVSELNRNQSNRNAVSKQPDLSRQDNLQMNGKQDGRDQMQMMHLLKSVVNHSAQGQADSAQNAKLMAALMAVMEVSASIHTKILPEAVRSQKLISKFKVCTNESEDFHTPTKSNNPPLPNEKTPPSAMNDTKKVKRSKKVVKSPNVSTESVNTTASMSDMRKVLHELESEIAAYEHQTGRRPHGETQKTETFSGYTVALVTACSRLTRYLKETDLRVRTEVTLREQLTQDVYQLRTIIDALATDIIVTQEEYGKLYSEHQRYRENTQAEIASLTSQMRELRHIITGEDQRPVTQQTDTDLTQATEQPKQQPQQQNFQDSVTQSNTSQKTEESKTSTPRQGQLDTSAHSESGSYQALPTHLRPTESAVTSATAAVMLSPPVRKTRVHTNAQASATGNGDAKLSHEFEQPLAQKYFAIASVKSERQTSLVDIAHLTSEGCGRSADPPSLTQAPPVMNTVSVPRPIPLVQSNMSIPLTSALSVSQGQGYTVSAGQAGKSQVPTIHPGQIKDLSDLVKLGDETEQQLKHLQEMAVEEALNNPAMQNLMQTQIAELNRQQEEARRRLVDLLDNQRLQQKRLQDQLGADFSVEDFSPIRGEDDRQSNNQQFQPATVSPPISPIPQRSDQQVPKTTEIPMLPANQGITVTLPLVDLDVSGGSLGSPR